MIDSISEEAKPRRRKKADSLDREPPHSVEAEQCVLGSILWQPSCLSECVIKFAGPEPQFYDLRHQEIYDTAADMFRHHEHIDIITLQQRLKDRQMLEQVGGVTYLMSLQDVVPSAANLSDYLGIVLEKSRLRRMIRTCSDIVARAYEYEGEVDDLIDSAELEIMRISESRQSKDLDSESSVKRLLEYDVENDGRCVLGFRNGKPLRWLCQGQSAWFVGQSGIGKSSLLLQMAVLWCLGLDFCGVGPGGRKLRILYVQAENDEGDMSEQVKGVVSAIGEQLEFEALDIDSLDTNLKVIRSRGKVGPAFFAWLEKETIKHHADVAMFDPLLSFAGIDLSRQDQCSSLFAIVDKVLERTKVVLIGSHHTTKPKDKKSTEGFTAYDFSYAGAGSSVLTNWARAIAVLSPLGEGKFQLMFTKREKRTGAVDLDGRPTTVLYLQHALNRICWEQTVEPEQSEPDDKSHSRAGRPNKCDALLAIGLGPVIDKLTEAVGLNHLTKAIEAFAASKKMDVKRTTCQQAVAKLVENGALVKVGSDYKKP